VLVTPAPVVTPLFGTYTVIVPIALVPFFSDPVPICAALGVVPLMVVTAIAIVIPLIGRKAGNWQRKGYTK
jgi:hypothetical protein